MKFTYESLLPRVCLLVFAGATLILIGILIALTALEERSGYEAELKGSCFEVIAQLAVFMAAIAIIPLFALAIRELVSGWNGRSARRNAILVTLAIMGNGWFAVLVCNDRIRRFLFANQQNLK